MPMYANAGFSDNEVRFSSLAISSSIDLFEIIIILFIVSLIVSKTISFNNKNEKDTAARQQALEQVRRPDDYRNIDPLFSEEDFRGLLAEMFIRLQKCLHSKDITDMRRYMTNDLYLYTEQQLQHYSSIHQTNHIGNVNVLDVQLKGWKKGETIITMIADIKADMIYYITDDNTGEIVSGSNTRPITLCYEVTVTRPIGIRSKGSSIHTCPNCNSHIDINYSGVCQYCGTHIMTQNTGWTLNTITTAPLQSRGNEQ